MKKVFSVFMSAVLMIGMWFFPVRAYEMREIPLEEFSNGECSLQSRFLWAGEDYHTNLAASFAETLHAMLIPFDVGRIYGTEYDWVISNYDLDEMWSVYRLDEIQQTFNLTYGTDIDMLSLNGLCFDEVDQPFIKVVDNYFCAELFPYGEFFEPTALYGYQLNDTTEYWIWNWQEPLWNREDDSTDYYQSAWNYTIAVKQQVLGYDIKTIAYHSTTPPSESLLAGFGGQEPEITVTLNGEPIGFDQPPMIQNGRTLVPMRAIFEAMGCDVYWDASAQEVDVWQGDDNVMTLWIDDYEMWVPDGIVELDVPPQIINNRTLVPVRAISEALNCYVDWDAATRTVIIEAETEYIDTDDVDDIGIEMLTWGSAYGWVIQELFGEPDWKTEKHIEDYTGYYYQDWVYESQGVTFRMCFENEDDMPYVDASKFCAPSELRLNNGLGIGSAYAEVLEAHSAYDDGYDLEIYDDYIWYVGDGAGGYSFSIENGVVSSIYIGLLWE